MPSVVLETDGTGGIKGTLKAAVGMGAGWSVFKNGPPLCFGPPQSLILTL